jgi:hypothetical protein
LLEQPAASWRLGAPTQAALLGAAGTLAPLLAWAPEGRTTLLDRDSAEALIAASTTALLGLTIVAAGRARLRRRLDLGAAERARAALAASVASLVLGSAAVTFGLGRFSQVLPCSLLGAAAGIAGTCIVRDAVRLSRTHRTIIVLLTAGTPVAFVAALAATYVPSAAIAAVFAAVAIALAIGIAAPTFSVPLAPEQSRWLDVLAAADLRASRGDPQTVLASVLSELWGLAGASAPSAALFRVDSQSMTAVDLAGYTHEEPAVLPSSILDLAAREPERVLRLEVLESLEVRRADVRPLANWLRERKASCLVWLGEADTAAGALLVPAGSRTQPLTLEEARALRRLGDTLATLVLTSSSMAASHARAVDASRRADEAELRMRQTEVVARRDIARHEAAARRLARPALIAAYSPAARLCMQQLESLAETDQPITLLTPVGADPIPYAAVAHLASRRKGGQLFVVDASDRADHSAGDWTDSSTSPLTLAHGGTLFVLSAPSLPEPTQNLLAQTMRDRALPGPLSRALDLLVVVSVPATVDVLAASGRMTSALADYLGDRAVPIPPLSARAEDLRALLLDRLARAGMKWRGKPLGIDPAAQALLLEHEWPGNDLELEDIVTRAAVMAQGDVLTRADLDRMGFAAKVGLAPKHTLSFPPPSLPPREAKVGRVRRAGPSR